MTSKSMITYNEDEIIEQTLDYSDKQSIRCTDPSSKSIAPEDYYEIVKTVDLLDESNVDNSQTKQRKVALQFPDELLADARLVVQMLKKQAEKKNLKVDFYVLGLIVFLIDFVFELFLLCLYKKEEEKKVIVENNTIRKNDFFFSKSCHFLIAHYLTTYR